MNLKTICSLVPVAIKDDQHLQSVSERRRAAAGRHQFGGGQVRRRTLPLREEDRRADPQHGGDPQPDEEHSNPQRGRPPATVFFGTFSFLDLFVSALISSGSARQC